MNTTPIYTMTVFEKTPKVSNGDRGQRTWGFMHDRADAEEYLLENYGDAFEGGWYEYAVVEEMAPGSFFGAPKVAWFKATLTEDRENVTVERCEAPAWADSICNWAMG